MSEKLVKVKILKNVGNYREGQEVEVSETDAKAMCTVRKKNNGHGLVDHRTAIDLAEFNRLKELPVNLGGLTVDEAKEMGVKNTIVLPKEELERPFHPGFVEKKDPAEMASAKDSLEMNAKNPSSFKRRSS